MENQFTFANAACKKLLLKMADEEFLGKTSSEVAQILRGRGMIYTFGELCCDSDTITKDIGGATTFFEYGLVDGDYMALRVLKAPLFDGDVMVGTIGAAQNVTWLMHRWDQTLDLMDKGRNKEAEALLRRTRIEFEGFKDQYFGHKVKRGQK